MTIDYQFEELTFKEINKVNNFLNIILIIYFLNNHCLLMTYSFSGNIPLGLYYVFNLFQTTNKIYKLMYYFNLRV